MPEIYDTGYSSYIVKSSVLFFWKIKNALCYFQVALLCLFLALDPGNDKSKGSLHLCFLNCWGKLISFRYICSGTWVLFSKCTFSKIILILNFFWNAHSAISLRLIFLLHVLCSGSGVDCQDPTLYILSIICDDKI